MSESQKKKKCCLSKTDQNEISFNLLIVFILKSVQILKVLRELYEHLKYFIDY